MTNERNWYDRKRINKRAIKNRDRRKQRLGEQSENPRLQALKSDDESIDGQNQDSKTQIGVISEVQKQYCIILFKDQYYRCETANIPRLPDSVQLVVGDRVTFNLADHEQEVVIQYVWPRLTKISRLRQDATRHSEYTKEEQILAANIDIAVIVAAATSPRFHPGLVDRYLVMCQYGGVSPALCINKIDLVETPPNLTIYEEMGIPVVYVSAATGEGLDALRKLLKGKYAVLTGHSGVGKSTIINALIGKDLLKIGAVGEKAGWGRHTTSVSTLNKIDDDTYLIDTPGIRALGLWNIEKSFLRFYFPEFQPYRLYCKFNDCLHIHEPNCAVIEAVARGGINKARYESYLRMMNE